AVVGATGTIGRPLVVALADAGHDVVAVSRRPPESGHDPRITHAAADASDQIAIARAVESADVLYHLVHSLGQPDFEAVDRAAARAVAAGAAQGGARQIVYLGGLGSEHGDLSPHLRSRAETARVLQAGQV